MLQPKGSYVYRRAVCNLAGRQYVGGEDSSSATGAQQQRCTAVVASVTAGQTPLEGLLALLAAKQVRIGTRQPELPASWLRFEGRE